MSVNCRQCGFENADGAVFCANCQTTVIDDASFLDEMEPLPDDFEEQVRTALEGKVRIIGEVGRGGMAVVYEGLDLELNRRVAVKCLPIENATDKNLVQRFHLEAKMAAGLTHPHIVPIYAVGTVDRLHYFTMAFLQGGSLEDKIDSGLSLHESVEIVCQIASALEYAHSKNLVHRDVKPSNVMFDENGTVRVLDFGVARMLHEARLTITRAILGTPEYMSPEQALSRPLDGRADLYALGTMFYQMVTRALPFTADEPLSLIYKHVNEKPVPPHNVSEEVPPAISKVILKLMAKDPEKRYASGSELTQELRSPEMVSALQPRAARRLGNGFTRLPYKMHSRWLRASITQRLLLGVAPLAVLLAWLLWPTSSAPLPLPEPEAIMLEHRPAFPDTEPARGEDGGDVDTGPLPVEPDVTETPPQKTVGVVEEPAPKPVTRPKPTAVITRKPKPDVLTKLLARFKFVDIGGDSFRMGGRRNGSDAVPAHNLILSGFSLSQTEVTQELWEAVMGDNPSCNKGQSFPVENVTWEAAVQFIERLNSRGKGHYRLPTEAEWEYVAKTGKKGLYGPLNLDTQGWYEKNAQQTQPVRGKDPNGLGVFDIHGSVWEWCSDYYAADYYGRSEERNPQGPDAGTGRVLRGGAFNSKSQETKPQNRHFLPANETDCSVGFRLVRTL